MLFRAKIPPQVPPDQCCIIRGNDTDRCGEPAVEWWLRPIGMTSLCERCAPLWHKLRMRPTYRQMTYEEALVLYVHSL